MTKRVLIVAMLTALLLLCGACSPATGSEPSPTAPPAVQPAGSTTAPTVSAGGEAQGTAASATAQQSTPPETTAQSDLYDPSIFVIEVKGTWQQELAPGYLVDYECEMYLDKVDASDNRDEAGLYTGVFWMKTELQADEFIEKMLKDAPVEMDFAGSGEGICDNATIHLRAEYDWDPIENYSFPGGGATVEPAAGMALAKGGFQVVGTEDYLKAGAEGA